MQCFFVEVSFLDALRTLSFADGAAHDHAVGGPDGFADAAADDASDDHTVGGGDRNDPR